MELESQALNTAGELVESARQALDYLERSQAPTDRDADDERVGASETLRNKTDTDAHALEAKRLLRGILRQGQQVFDEVKQTPSLEMTQTCETVIQVTKDSLGKEVDERVLNHWAALQESVSEAKQEGVVREWWSGSTRSPAGHGVRNVVLHRRCQATRGESAERGGEVSACFSQMMFGMYSVVKFFPESQNDVQFFVGMWWIAFFVPRTGGRERERERKKKKKK